MAVTGTQRLVTNEEAMTLTYHYRDAKDAYIADDLFQYLAKNINDFDYRWKHLRIVMTIWNAGRIQGIREERAKKRKGFEV